MKRTRPDSVSSPEHHIITVDSESDSEHTEPLQHGLDPGSIRELSRILGVDTRVTPTETLAYSLLCKASRGVPLAKPDLLDIWKSIPRKYVLSQRGNSQGRLISFGVNPRATHKYSVATHAMPRVYELLQKYLQQCDPSFRCSSICIMQNCFKGPHRDLKNLGDNMIICLTNHVDGGGLWVADTSGPEYQDFEGVSIAGRFVQLDEAFRFPARSVIHATQPWQEKQRIVVVGFTPIGTLALQYPPPLKPVRQTRIPDFFNSGEHVD